MVISASETRSVALARWTSEATRGTVDATPGWNSAAPTPATELSAYTAHSGGLPVAKETASTEAPTSRSASAMIIMRRGVNRSASTPPKSTNTASGPIQQASA